MSTTTVPAGDARDRLKNVQRAHKRIVAEERLLRAVRDTAVHDAKAHQVPITHLATAAGVSREILHRILRTPPQTCMDPASSSLLEAIQQLTDAQEALAETVQRRSSLEQSRAQLIRSVVSTSSTSRKEVAQLAGVTTETVRKLCHP